CGEVYAPTFQPAARPMASMKATVEPLPLVPATVTTWVAGRDRPRRPATSRTRSRPISMAVGCWRSMCASHCCRVIGAGSRAGQSTLPVPPVPGTARPVLQGAVLGLAEERGVVGAVVQAHHFQAVHVRALEQVERGGRLAEGPQLADRQAQDPAQQDAVD